MGQSGVAGGSTADPSTGPMILVAERVLTPDQELTPGWVEIAGGRVGGLGAGPPPGRRAAHVLAPGCTLAPGLVEMHVHGAGGGNMTALDPAEFHRACQALLRFGATSTVASLLTAPLTELEDALALIADLAAEDPPGQARLVGAHLEGPFLAPEHRGAHDEASLRRPDGSATQRLLKAGRGTVRMMTLAPELPGANDVLRVLAADGVVAAMGHTGASYEQTRTALAQGVTVGTHLFNGMRTPHHREPGPALSLLDDARVTVELINDGVHVHPAVARVAARAAGDGRLALISDAVAATGAPDGEYLLGRTVIRSSGGMVLTADGRSLGGGSLTLGACVRRAVDILGLPLTTAVAAATSVPARALGIADRAGQVAPGRWADLVVLDARLDVAGVMLDGRWVIEPPVAAHPAPSPEGASGSWPTL